MVYRFLVGGVNQSFRETLVSFQRWSVGFEPPRFGVNFAAESPAACLQTRKLKYLSNNLGFDLVENCGWSFFGSQFSQQGKRTAFPDARAALRASQLALIRSARFLFSAFPSTAPKKVGYRIAGSEKLSLVTRTPVRKKTTSILKNNNHQPQAMHYNIPKMQIHTLVSDAAGTGICGSCETTEH